VSASDVSVVIPARNAERYVCEALDSVLAQTSVPAEVVVVDDGSTDRTAELARGYGDPIRVVCQPALGLGPARNRGVAEARARLVAFLDADDLWPPDALAVRMAALDTPGAPDMAFGHVAQFVRLGTDGLPLPVGEIAPAHVAGGLLARRSVFELVGPFREDLHAGEFIDWLARARDLRLSELLLDHVVLFRRLHDANHGRLQRAATRTDIVRAVKAVLDRRRAAEPST
jgi:glycosyltransferase involved in cell wall biosynthesis